MSISLNSSDNSRQISKGDVLFHEGDTPNSYFLILSGRFACVKKGTEKPIVIMTVQEKSILAEDCIFLDTKSYYYSAIALEDSEVIEILKSDVYKYLSSQSEWIKNIFHNISEKIRNTVELIEEHKITDEKLYGNIALSNEELALIRNRF